MKQQAPAPTLRYRVVSIVRRIPPGRVATYGDVAEWAGAPGAARAVGTIMATTLGGTAPCHRVIASGGRLGGYGGHESLKRALLEAEGIRVRGRSIAGFSAVRWAGPPGAASPVPPRRQSGSSSRTRSR